MNKLELIQEAEEKLIAENLEKEKQKVLSEVRFIESRIQNHKNHIIMVEGNLENIKANLEKEQIAADNYKQTGDYEAYKKELGIIENYSTLLGIPTSTCTAFYRNNCGVWK